MADLSSDTDTNKHTGAGSATLEVTDTVTHTPAATASSESVNDATAVATARVEDTADSATNKALAYTERGFTSEVFKVELNNVPPHSMQGDLRKLCHKFDLEPVKMKKMEGWEVAWITFRNEESREKAVKSFHGLTFKGYKLRAKKSQAAEDPFFARQKKKNKSRDNQNDSRKRRKNTDEEDENDSRTPSEKLFDKVTPLWRSTYPEQLKEKFDILAKQFKKSAKIFDGNKFSGPTPYWVTNSRKANGGLPCSMAAVIPSPIEKFYRNKCEFTVGFTDKENPTQKDITVGFLAGKYQDGIVTTTSARGCLHVMEPAHAIVEAFQGFLREHTLPPFSRVTHKGFWKQIMVRTPSSGDHVAVISVTSLDTTQEQVDTAREAIKAFFEKKIADGLTLNSVLWDVCTDAHGRETNTTTLIGRETFEEHMLGLKFQVSWNAFFQVNTAAAEVLLALVKTWLKEATGETTPIVLDICCGTGTIGIALADAASKVIGVELIPEAIEDAKKNAAANNVSEKTTYIAGKAEDTMKHVFLELPPDQAVVGVVDPPRAGLHPKVVQAIRKCEKLKTLIYISCSLGGATSNLIDLCRPTSKKFAGKPFRMVKAQPVDLFPQTTHCELVIHLERD